MIKSAETCETRRQEVYSVRYIFIFLSDDQIDVFLNLEKINMKLVSLNYSNIFDESYIYICICLIS